MIALISCRPDARTHASNSSSALSVSVSKVSELVSIEGQRLVLASDGLTEQLQGPLPGARFPVLVLRLLVQDAAEELVRLRLRLEQDGLRLTTNIVSCQPDQVRIGMTVRVVFEPFEDVALQGMTAIRHAFKGVPVIILSDAKSALQPRTIRNALKSGAQGFIPTRTTEMPVAFAAIRFVKAGGTFAPIDLLLSARPERAVAASEAPLRGRLAGFLDRVGGI